MATKTIKPAASAAPTNTKDTNFTTETAEVENPKKNLTLTPPDASTPASDSISPSQEKPPTAAGDTEGATNGTDTKAKETEAGSGLPSNDVEKKIRRAERFGVPVKLSEEEKRNSRAERFGTLTGSDGAKSSEDLKRKARADRFGLSANPTTTTSAAAAADEDAKKKARLARFGSSVKVDSQEEEKRKARALRFAKASANEKQKVEMETVAAGNTTGGA